MMTRNLAASLFAVPTVVGLLLLAPALALAQADAPVSPEAVAAQASPAPSADALATEAAPAVAAKD